MTAPNFMLFVALSLPAIAAWFAASTYYQYLRLKHVPGPKSAGFSRWWFLRATLSGRTHLDLYEVCEKYGALSSPETRSIVGDGHEQKGLVDATC